jgi:hypothetical protein
MLTQRASRESFGKACEACNSLPPSFREDLEQSPRNEEAQYFPKQRRIRKELRVSRISMNMTLLPQALYISMIALVTALLVERRSSPLSTSFLNNSENATKLDFTFRLSTL